MLFTGRVLVVLQVHGNAVVVSQDLTVVFTRDEINKVTGRRYDQLYSLVLKQKKTPNTATTAAITDIMQTTIS